MAINCPKCNTSNPETVKFCGECGTQLHAIENYEKFLDLWKDADQGTTEVEDARKKGGAVLKLPKIV